MKLISWNIKWGGRSRLDLIYSLLLERSPEVIVLGEFVQGTTEPLLERLSLDGWSHQEISDPPEKRGGVAIISRLPLEKRETPASMSEHFRYAGVGIPSVGLELRGIYAPLSRDPYHEFWEALLDSLANESEKPVLVLGDLNASLPKIDTTSTSSLFSTKYFKRLPSCGYTDLWRTSNESTEDFCSWMGRTHPYRLDHAFGTPSVASRIRSCEYDHSVRLRGLSDHSLLSVSID